MFLSAKRKLNGRTLLSAVATISLLVIAPAYAAAPSAGGNTTVVKPSDETAVSVTEDAVQPESANIRLIVSTLSDSDGGTPSKIRILSVTGGTLWDSGGGTITLGAAGTELSLSSGKVDLRFRPTSNRDTNASFQYVVVDVQDESINSSASTATIPITAVNDAPIMQTVSGDNGTGLAATYYISSWDLTGTTYNRIDSTINFGNNFNVPGYNADNFSARWTGQVKAPITGNITFSTVSDDGVRLWINDNLVIDNWTVHGDTTDTASPITMTGGTKYNVKMEFYERGGGETASLRWAYTGQSTVVIPQASLFPATSRPTLTYVNGSASAIIDDAITISDVDNTTASSGSVVISSGYTSGEDSLLFTNQNGITGSYSAGTLILTGTTSMANYQTALRSVRYANSNASPDTTTRTIKFKMNDGHDDSNFTFRNIGFTATNTAPVITAGTSTGVTMDENSSPTAFSLTLSATDAENQSIIWSISGAASHGTASASGAGDSMAISYAPNTNYFGSDSFIVQASDGSSTDTITVNVTITDRTPPTLSSIATSSVTASGATITWTSNVNASTKVNYGLNTSYGTNTTETDTSSRVTSHTKSLSGLLACTQYHYAVISTDSSSNTATSSDKIFTTAGCRGDATIKAGTGTSIIYNALGSTGSIILSGTGRSLSLSVPSGYVASNVTCPTGVNFQLKELAASNVESALGSPSGRNTIVSAHDLSAYCPDSTRVTSFDKSLTVTFTYADSDISGLVESSLSVYRYGSDSTAWDELTCSQDMSANTLTCSTTHFSSFGLFGTPTSSSDTTSTTSTSNRSGGCRGSGCGDLLLTNPLAYRRASMPSVQTTTGNTPLAAPCATDTVPGKKGLLWMSVGSHSVLFSDVPLSAWFACPVHRVIEKEIFSGYMDGNGNPTGLYGPADPISLGQLAKVAVKLAGKQVVTTQMIGQEWALPYMQEAEKMGLSAFLNKIDEGMPATRGAVVQTILEALKIPLQDAALPYSDVPTGSMYAKAIGTATKLGIVNGDAEQNTFRPNAPINRAEVAKMIVLALEIER